MYEAATQVQVERRLDLLVKKSWFFSQFNLFMLCSFCRNRADIILSRFFDQASLRDSFLLEPDSFGFFTWFALLFLSRNFVIVMLFMIPCSTLIKLLPFFSLQSSLESVKSLSQIP